MKLSIRNYWCFTVERPLKVAFLALLVCGMNVPGFAQAVDGIDKLEKLYQIRGKQIPLLEDFIKKYPNSPKRPDTYFRLGEAYFETAKYHELKGDKSGSEARIMKAVQYLEELRKDHPTYQKLDEALFVLANAYMERKMVAQAGSVLADIADRYPDSPVIKQASLLLGDHYFAEKQFARAESYYLKAADDEKIRSYVHYKLGWVAMDQDQPAKALKYFEMVLNERGGANDYSKDAAKEMIWPAVQVHGSNKVVAYLESVLKDPALVESSLTTLAVGLQQKDEHTAAAQLYDSLRARYPSSPSQSEWMMAQIKSEEALGHTTKVQQLVTQMASTADASNPQALALLIQNAKKFHSEAQKAKDLQLKLKNYDMAIVYYQTYVTKVPQTDPGFYPAQFYLGEALFSRERFADARTAYETAAKSSSSVQTQAAWNWLLTAEKMAEGFSFKGTNFQATTPNDEKYLEAARFVQSVQGISLAQKRRASYQSARLLYQLNDYDRALPVFQALAESHAQSEEGRLSAQLVLDIFNLKKDYKRVAELARNYKASAVDSSSRSELSGIEQKATIKSIQEEERVAKAQQGEPRIAALETVGKKYLEYAKAYPKSELVDGSLWAAFQNLTEVAIEKKSSDYPEMKEAFRLLTTTYAASKHKSEAVMLMGKFLGARRLDPEQLREYRQYRDSWVRLMQEERRDEKGRMGMLIWRLSNDDQRRSLEADFAKLPMTDSNREAVAHGKLSKVRILHEKFEDIKLSKLKTLQKNTATKVNLLEQLQRDVTELAGMKVGEVTVAGLNVLADAYLSMASSFRTAPIPSQLSGENLQRYQGVVNEKAGEFEAKGQEARKLASDTAKELNLSGS